MAKTEATITMQANILATKFETDEIKPTSYVKAVETLDNIDGDTDGKNKEEKLSSIQPKM